MTVYPNFDESNKLVSFEVPNGRLSRRGAVKIVSALPGAHITRAPKRLLSWFREEIFCEFEIDGVVFEIEEPFGDNSRYLVSRKDGGWCGALEQVKNAFEAA